MTADATTPMHGSRAAAWRDDLAWLIRLALAALLFYAAWSKAAPPPAIVWEIPQARTIFDDNFPPGTFRRAAFLAMEFLTATWLLLGWRPKWSLLWTGTLLTIFTIVIGYELTRPDPRACGCLPVDPNTNRAIDPHAQLRASFTRNLFALCLVSVGVGLLTYRPREPGGTTRPPTSAGGPTREPSP
jgi:uncharacterized membrane protein YphA (DoxX/SURF4 family)